MKKFPRTLASVLSPLVALTLLSCGGGSSGPSGDGEGFVAVPDAEFKKGPAPSPKGNISYFRLTSAKHSGGLATTSTTTWTIRWKVTLMKVRYVLLDVPELGGYFKYEVTADEAVRGEADFPMVYSTEKPKCNRTYTGNGVCYVPAATRTTDTGWSIELMGNYMDDIGVGDIGAPIGGAGLTWGPRDTPPSTPPADAVCGNGTCESGEGAANCPSDCGSGGKCAKSGEVFCSDSAPFCSGMTVKACVDKAGGWYRVTKNGQSAEYCCDGYNCARAASLVVNTYCAGKSVSSEVFPGQDANQELFAGSVR